MEAQTKIRCIAVDDEPPALQLLVSYIHQIDSLELVFQTHSALTAYNFVRQNDVDLLFLDIQMPGLTGLDFIRALHHKPAVILTTAYREYAVEGFELDVLDYLVKPIKFERFLKAVSKYSQIFPARKPESESSKPALAEDVYMYFTFNKEVIKVYLKDILYVESIKDYVKIITPQKTLVTYQRISYLEEKLPDTTFMRVHKSFIVNIDKITALKGDSIQLGSIQIPIGRFFKKNLIDVYNDAKQG